MRNFSSAILLAILNQVPGVTHYDAVCW